MFYPDVLSLRTRGHGALLKGKEYSDKQSNLITYAIL
jgi:hypothetical protein